MNLLQRWAFLAIGMGAVYQGSRLIALVAKNDVNKAKAPPREGPFPGWTPPSTLDVYLDQMTEQAKDLDPAAGYRHAFVGVDHRRCRLCVMPPLHPIHTSE